jgi:carbonic anhydrase/acetyltransferase-like protein (isoleucine patch superfamily)
MTRAVLESAIETARRYPHKHVNRGELIIAPEAFETPGMETNLLISRFSMLDCTGSIHIGPWCNISARCRIYTHDHIHMGLEPLLAVEEEYGVVWQDKYIGSDVWIHDSAMVLSQVTHIPDGVVLGAGAVLTKNPGPYEIWAGVPAVKIDKRTEVDPADIRAFVEQKRFSLD